MIVISRNICKYGIGFHTFFPLFFLQIKCSTHDLKNHNCFFTGYVISHAILHVLPIFFLQRVAAKIKGPCSIFRRLRFSGGGHGHDRGRSQRGCPAPARARSGLFRLMVESVSESKETFSEIFFGVNIFVFEIPTWCYPLFLACGYLSSIHEKSHSFTHFVPS